MKTKKPNVLLLVVDALRADRMSCYGHNRNNTPFLNEFKKECIIFKNHYTVAIRSLSAHISLMTGKHPVNHKACNDWCVYRERYPLITEILKNNGYHTLGVSTFNSFLSPEKGFIRGFDEYVRIVKASKQIISPKVVANVNFAVKQKNYISKLQYKIYRLSNGIKNRLGIETNKIKEYRYLEKFFLKNDSCGEKTVKTILEKVKNKANKNKPFFIFSNILDTHRPFLMKEKFRHKFGDLKLTDNILKSLFEQKELSAGLYKLNEEEIETIKKCYDTSVLHTDSLVNKLITGLKEISNLDDWLIIITSDHGEELLEHENVFGHVGILYQPAIKIPLLIRYPKIASSKEITELTCIMDIAPFICSICDCKEDIDTDGINLLDIISKKKKHEYIVSDTTDFPSLNFAKKYPEFFFKFNKIQRSILDGKNKFIWTSKGDHKLYNLVEDPLEKTNLYTAENRETIDEYMTKMKNWYQNTIGSKNLFSFAKYDYNYIEDSESSLDLAESIGKVVVIQDEVNF